MTQVTLNVPDSGIIQSIKFGFLISHSYASDLYIYVVPPGKIPRTLKTKCANTFLRKNFIVGVNFPDGLHRISSSHRRSCRIG
jgi:subtilisin-like proprotein convertase family protein